MLNFPEKPGQHRNYLVFGANLIACVAKTTIFECYRVTIFQDWIRRPRRKSTTQDFVYFYQPTRRKRENTNASQILQARQRVRYGPITVESGTFVAPSKRFKGTFAVLNP